jgi:membrane protease YdiL (CAAX protease family)
VTGSAETPAKDPPRAVLRYAIAVVITVFVILSQYFLPQNVPALLPIYSSLPGDLFVVYGIPVIAFAVLVGAGPLRNWLGRLRVAAYEGLSWYAGATIVTLVVLFVMVIVYNAVDPAALKLLSRQNPALTQAAGDPWFWVGFSFVIGAFEETIFRGWIYGFWRGRTRGWIAPAVGSSVLFAGVHLYYGTTYGPAAPLIFPGLFLLGFAFAATYQASGGNLLVVALLHGLYDASAFLTLVDGNLGLLVRYLPVLIGVVLLLIRFLAQDAASKLPPLTPVPAPGGGPTAAFPSGPVSPPTPPS